MQRETRIARMGFEALTYLARGQVGCISFFGVLMPAPCLEGMAQAEATWRGCAKAKVLDCCSATLAMADDSVSDWLSGASQWAGVAAIPTAIVCTAGYASAFKRHALTAAATTGRVNRVFLSRLEALRWAMQMATEGPAAPLLDPRRRSSAPTLLRP